MLHLNSFETHSWYLLFALFLIILNAFFVAAEFGMVKIRVTQLELLANKGNPLARIAYRMVNQLDAYLSVCQLGITLASLGLGWIGEPALARVIHQTFETVGLQVSMRTLHSVSIMLAFLILSALHIILGELVPKSIAIRTAEKICLIVAIPMRIFYILFFPFMWILNGLSNLILKIIRVPPAGGPARAHSEEEIKLIVEDSYEDGAIGPGKKSLLDKAIDFSHKTVFHIMVPANQVVYMRLSETVGDNLTYIKESGHTRFPLFDLKNKNIIGFVHVKDVIWSLEHGEVINLFDLKRPVLFFDQETRLDRALKVFQKRKIHMAVVINSKGEPQGIVTLEDVIEELVGEIEDEFDV